MISFICSQSMLDSRRTDAAGVESMSMNTEGRIEPPAPRREKTPVERIRSGMCIYDPVGNIKGRVDEWGHIYDPVGNIKGRCRELRSPCMFPTGASAPPKPLPSPPLQLAVLSVHIPISHSASFLHEPPRFTIMPYS